MTFLTNEQKARIETSKPSRDIMENAETLYSIEGGCLGFYTQRGELRVHNAPHISLSGEVLLNGWWEWPNGSEGGEIKIDLIDMALVDIDGCMDIPKIVREALDAAGVSYEH